MKQLIICIILFIFYININTTYASIDNNEYNYKIINFISNFENKYKNDSDKIIKFTKIKNRLNKINEENHLSNPKIAILIKIIDIKIKQYKENISYKNFKRIVHA
jgi:hypothetical protein